MESKNNISRDGHSILDLMLQKRASIDFILAKVRQLPAIVDEFENFILKTPFIPRYKKSNGLLFVKCLRGYLATGLNFQSNDHISNYYQNEVKVENPFKFGIPWPVGLLQSYWHLIADNISRELKDNIQRQNKAVILVSLYNERKFTEVCFKALRKFTNFPCSIVAVNNSKINMSDFKLHLMQNRLIDFWFESGFNEHAQGLQAVLPHVQEHKYVCTLDSDAIVLEKNWLNNLIVKMESENAGLVGPLTFPNGKSIKAWGIHPCCMVMNLDKIAGKFQVDFCNQWPWDVGHLVTWDCIANNIPVSIVSHDVNQCYSTGWSTVNNSVRHFWYTSRILQKADEDMIDNIPVGPIRQKLNRAYNSPEIQAIAVNF